MSSIYLPLSFEEYRIAYHNFGFYREWEVKIGYDLYLAYFYNDPEQIQKAYKSMEENYKAFHLGTLN